MAQYGVLKHYSSGLTVKALIRNSAGQLWDGSAYIEPSAIATIAAWRTLLFDCTEQILTDSTKTGQYKTTDIEAAVPCVVEYYSGSAPLPTDAMIGIQEITAPIRTELATELGRIDAAISTRLASTGYTTPPTKEQIATQVESQVISEVDGNLVLKAITDKIASVNPSLSGLTLAAIASQVRTELATELARIDAAISTRLAAAGYTTPPTSGVIATQVRSELATELGRIDAAVSTRLPSSAYTAPPTDYQQRNVAVVLPDGVATEAKQDVAAIAIANIPTEPLLANDARLPSTIIASASDVANMSTFDPSTDKVQLADIDGIQSDRVLRALLAFVGAPRMTVTDLGTGIRWAVMYRQDGTTPALTVEYDVATGAISTTTIGV